jgi:dihydrodipicolinate reductase
MRRPNPRNIHTEKRKVSQIKVPVNIFNKIIEANSPNLKKEMSINIREAHRNSK